MGGNRMRTPAATDSAVCQIRLSSPVEMAAASRPLTLIARRSLARKRQSRYRQRARPRASKPGPRLALEAGTRTVDHGIHDIRAYCSGAARRQLLVAAPHLVPAHPDGVRKRSHAPPRADLGPRHVAPLYRHLDLPVAQAPPDEKHFHVEAEAFQQLASKDFARCAGFKKFKAALRVLDYL